MRYVKIMLLATTVAAALMAWVGTGSASAVTLTCGAGVVCPVGTVIHMENEGHLTLHPPIGSFTCKTSTIEGTTTNTGGIVNGKTETVKGHNTFVSFGDHGRPCNDGSLVTTALQKGTLEFHSLGDGAATLTSSGMILTNTYSGFHCIFSTNNTDVGKVTDSNVTKSNATFDIEAVIPRTGGTSGVFCGPTAEWTGKFKITKPNPLFID